MEFIHPNWHVILIHYPLGLLTVGVLLELITIFWSKEGLRTAGRWMLLLGTFLAIPTVTSGLYAYRDAVRPQVPTVELATWPTIAAESPWIAAQWEALESHIWLNTSSVVCFLVVVVTWIVASARWRHRLYWPLVLLMLAGLGLMAAGAWHGGEAVYRYGTAVELPAGDPEPPLAEAQKQIAARLQGAHEAAPPPPPGMIPEGKVIERATGTLGFFLPPLQLHVVLAGFVVALAIATLAIAARHLCQTHDSKPSEEQLREQRRTRRGFWWTTFVVALLTAAAGDWATLSTLGENPVRKNLQMLTDPAHLRLILHVVVGLGIVLIPMLFAIGLHYQRERTGWSKLGVALVLVTVPLQLWLGTLMLFDGHEGPLYRFNAAGEPAAHAHDHPPGHDHADDHIHHHEH